MAPHAMSIMFVLFALACLINRCSHNVVVHMLLPCFLKKGQIFLQGMHMRCVQICSVHVRTENLHVRIHAHLTGSYAQICVIGRFTCMCMQTSSTGATTSMLASSTSARMLCAFMRQHACVRSMHMPNNHMQINGTSACWLMSACRGTMHCSAAFMHVHAAVNGLIVRLIQCGVHTCVPHGKATVCSLCAHRRNGREHRLNAGMCTWHESVLSLLARPSQGFVMISGFSVKWSLQLDQV